MKRRRGRYIHRSSRRRWVWRPCEGKTINEIGQEYGVHPVQVGQWKKAIQEQAKTLFEGKRGLKPLAAHREPERLYSEIGKLKRELDWLKKKSGISPS